jgi:hypothetical protein
VTSGGQFEQLVDEPNVTPNIIALRPPNLTLPDHVHRLRSLNSSPAVGILGTLVSGIAPAFDGAMVLVQDVVSVLHRPTPERSRSVRFFLT